ncbi:helix-turn-helix domain-containing protein [Paenibacillus pasadenensis]|uniref:Transcriptional regulator, AraC family n=1 Tax=Paenibacillus pasadenensis TaxID=217090 RepID=A0A2N5N374_9BACL|nr:MULTISPECIES: AraC family transcriptional regulator [Paenibacillus]PLT44770.1 Transcriptional regulator, AraC family [Paenibacillus pasadenensis]QGG55233.1 helix-turn-helix domain-containing protein [Paenibacillus sp. B01]
MADAAAAPGGGAVLSETMFADVKTTLNLFGIHRREVRGDWSYPPHQHPQYEINFLLAGSQIMTVGGRELVQSPGDLLLIRPGELHSSRSGDGLPFDYFCLHFDLDDRLFLPLLGRLDQTLFRAESELARKASPVLRKMLEPGQGGGPSSVAARMRLQAAAFELFAMLWDAITAESLLLPRASYAKEELAQEIASRLQGAASLNFRHARGPGAGGASAAKGGEGEEDEAEGDGPGGLRRIAAELGISASHCGRVFREVYGQSPRAYWSSLVLHESKQLLADSRHSIQMISSVLGYRDIAHFSRQFKRWTGLSPSAYRRLHLHSSDSGGTD